MTKLTIIFLFVLALCYLIGRFPLLAVFSTAIGVLAIVYLFKDT